MKKLLLLVMITLGVLTTSYAVKPHAKSIKKNNAELLVANPNAAGTFNDIKKPSFFNRVKMTAAKIIKKVNPADDGKLFAIIAHLTWVGTLIAYVLNMNAKNELASFYIRQNLGFLVLGLLAAAISYGAAFVLPILGLIGTILYIVIFVLWLISLLGALQGKQKLVPIFGKMFQNWFKSI